MKKIASLEQPEVDGLFTPAAMNIEVMFHGNGASILAHSQNIRIWPLALLPRKEWLNIFL